MESNVTVFRISDLLGKKKQNNCDSLKKKTLISKKYNKNKDNIVLEVSSFKISNKMIINGTTKKKKKVQQNKNDVMWFHEERLQYFKKLQESLPKKRLQLKSQEPSSPEYLKLRQEIEMIESRQEENDYMEKTRDIISRYNNANTGETTTTNDTIDTGNVSVSKYIKTFDNEEKNKLAEEYCRITNTGMMINPKNLVFNDNKCKECNGETRYVESFVTCMSCGFISKDSVCDYQISYKDLCDTMIKKGYEYNKKTRFREILASLQAKGNVDIPPFVINAIQQEIKKDYSRDIASIDIKKIKQYLKRCGLTSYYDHAPNILNSINGISPISIPIHIEDKLLKMFDKIQIPFEIVKKKVAPTRSSFLSYVFCLYKFCELLDLEEYKKHFTLLKDDDKLRLQDKIWKGICEMLKWEFIPSI